MRRLRADAAITLAVALCAASLLAQDMQTGREIYLAKCAKCHGKNGVPRRIAKGAPNFTDPKWSIPLEQIERSVIDGKGEEMPKFKSKLDLEQIRNVSAFVQSIKHGPLVPSNGHGADTGKE